MTFILFRKFKVMNIIVYLPMSLFVNFTFTISYATQPASIMQLIICKLSYQHPWVLFTVIAAVLKNKLYL